MSTVGSLTVYTPTSCCYFDPAFAHSLERRGSEKKTLQKNVNVNVSLQEVRVSQNIYGVVEYLWCVSAEMIKMS